MILYIIQFIIDTITIVRPLMCLGEWVGWVAGSWLMTHGGVSASQGCEATGRSSHPLLARVPRANVASKNERGDGFQPMGSQPPLSLKKLAKNMKIWKHQNYRNCSFVFWDRFSF